MIRGEVVAALKAKPGRDIWLFGGGELFRSLLDVTEQVAAPPVRGDVGSTIYNGSGHVESALRRARGALAAIDDEREVCVRVCVTGGAGFIGSWVTRTLLAEGHDVTIIDNLSKGYRSLVPEGAHFIEGDLNFVGVRSNRAAIGARIKVTVESTDGRRREVYRTVNTGGSFGAPPLQQHIGLGKASRIVEVEVNWPASGTRQVFADVPKNQVIEIREMTDRFATLDRKPLPLGGRRAR